MLKIQISYSNSVAYLNICHGRGVNIATILITERDRMGGVERQKDKGCYQ